MERVDGISSTNITFQARVERCFATYIDVAIERPHHYLAAFSSAGSQESQSSQDDSWEVFQDTNKGRAFGIIVSVVQDGQAQGVFDRALDPFLTAKSLWASMHGLAMLLIHLPGFTRMIPDPKNATPAEDFMSFHVGLMVRSLQSAHSVSSQPNGTNGAPHD